MTIVKGFYYKKIFKLINFTFIWKCVWIFLYRKQSSNISNVSLPKEDHAYYIQILDIKKKIIIIPGKSVLVIKCINLNYGSKVFCGKRARLHEKDGNKYFCEQKNEIKFSFWVYFLDRMLASSLSTCNWYWMALYPGQ